MSSFYLLVTYSLVFAARAAAVATSCGQIAQQYIDFVQKATNSENATEVLSGPNATNVPLYHFDAELGYACLQSSYLDKNLGVQYLEEYTKLLQFQSTLSYLKDPPRGYWYPPTDIIGQISNLSATTENGRFQSQYAFDQAILSVINSAHDGHLLYSPCSADALWFYRSLALVSMSSDGVAAPKIFILQNGEQLPTPNATNLSPDLSVLSISDYEVTEINGQAAAEFVENEALQRTMDQDAAYNIELWNYAGTYFRTAAYQGTSQPQRSFTGLLSSYPGPETNVTFANGTTMSYRSYAQINPSQGATWSKSNISDGTTFSKAFCIDPATTALEQFATLSSGGVAPSPVALHPYQGIAGYFINESQYLDLAVLVSPAEQTSGAQSYSDTVAAFLASAKASNKKKLVIDLTFNQGGNLMECYDLFRRLFPRQQIYETTRLRENAAATIYGQSSGGLPRNTSNPLWNMPWNFNTNLNATNGKFISYSDMFSANKFNGDNFTALLQVPFNDTAITLTGLGAPVPFGYSNDSFKNASLEQPFETDNIVVLTDGVCESSCTVFTNLMIQQGVRTIAIGGRPNHGPTQIMGGTKMC
ncbi:MAG: hypothetical protein M1821_000475 [Bathelium mastoideum]|nr:MAG: hypothetical protein M1821_000475 [Bathelium mastoideum]